MHDADLAPSLGVGPGVAWS